MTTEADMYAVVNRWRKNVKGKFRGIASFEERAGLRFDDIKKHIYKKRISVDNWKIRQARYRGWGDYKYLDRKWRPIKVGQYWGGNDVTAFFRQKIRIPKALDGEKVALQIFLGGDSLVTVNGKPYHGLDIFRNEMPLTEKAKAGEVFDVQIESYINYQGIKPNKNDIVASDLVAIDKEVRDAYWDLWCAAKLLNIENIDVKLRDFVETNLWEAMKVIPLREDDPAAFRRAVLKARKMVRKTIYASDRFKGEGMMYLVGHSHLDLVYMWPYKEFIRKVGRTHATMLRLMEEYPEFRFCQSQAKIYADMKKYYPHIFRQVKKRIAEGRWDAVGAFWVEPDCHLISGESFVRQIMHGQKFFQENFGMTSRTCWQPDVFGVSWGLPQILARSGVRYFVSNKMVPWNDTNPWTRHTFWWEGLDGSRVLGIVPPGHFMGTADADVIDKQWKAFSDKSEIGATLHVYGWGDGGGGVDPEMIESGLRYRDMPGLVNMEFTGAEEAFDRIGEKAADAKIPVLRDEIYLEAHRGTYTHKGRLKKLNRGAELLYREAEMMAAFAWAQTGRYPQKQLEEGWTELLNAQFHDSLPGTHVPPVYRDLLRDYEKIFSIGENVRSAAAAALAGPATGSPDALLVFNSTLRARNGIARVPEATVGGKTITDLDGNVLPQQTVTRIDGVKQRLVMLEDVPPVGFAGLKLKRGSAKRGKSSLSVSKTELENEHLRAKFNAEGELILLWDKDNGREVLVRGGKGNNFQLFEDTPGKYDAWDIVETYMDHPIDISGGGKVSVDERGPLRASLRLEKKFGGSKLVQRISLCADSRELVFETSIDWVERQRLLKVAFPVEINASHATYDIAYGNMPRATHRNTSHDRARFEVPAHQWMDLSQHDYGVSVLNDCKYGCDVHGKTMRLTLLKGSISPDPKADMENHMFTYALYPHAGDWRVGGTVAAAMAFNSPMLVLPRRTGSATKAAGRSLLGCTAGNVRLEAVKRSEDGKALIVRLVDRHNASTRAKLVFDRPVRAAWSCDLTEKPEKKLRVSGNTVAFTGKPYEIVTVGVEL